MSTVMHHQPAGTMESLRRGGGGGGGRQSLGPGREYHFNVIYNYARCPLSTTQDTQLSLAWTRQAVDVLHRHGLVSGYYHDRDCPKGRAMVQELSRVIRASEVTVVLLSPGFVRDCWPRYWLLSGFRSLFQSSSPSSSSSSSSVSQSKSFSTSSSHSLGSNNSWPSSSPRDRVNPTLSSSSSASSRGGSRDAIGSSGSSEVLLVALGLQKEELPVVLKDLDVDVLFFPERDWQRDRRAWLCLERGFGLAPLSAECLEEERCQMEQAESPGSSFHSAVSADSCGPHKHTTTTTTGTRPPPSVTSNSDRTQILASNSHGKQSLASNSHGTQSFASNRHGTQSLASNSHGTQSLASNSHGAQSLASNSHGTQSLASNSRGTQSLASNSHGTQSLASNSHRTQSLASNSHGTQSLASNSHGTQSLASNKHGTQSLASDRHGTQSLASNSHGTQSLASSSHRTPRNEDGPVSEDSAISVDDDDDETSGTNNRDDGGVRNSTGFLDMLGSKQRKKSTECSERLKEESCLVGQKGTPERGGDDDVESAVLDRLYHTGLRRESLEEENAMTRVFVHGNTVSIDTLRTSSGRRRTSPSGTMESNRCLYRSTETDGSSDICGYKERGTLISTDAELNSAISFSRRDDRDTRKDAANSQNSGLLSSAGDSTVSSQSPRRKLQYSEEYDSPSEASYSISLTTQNYERSSTSSPRSGKRDGVPHGTRLTARTENHAEESGSTSSSSLINPATTISGQKTVHSYRVYSPRKEGKGVFSGRDEIDSSLNSMILNKSSSSAAADSCEYDRVTQNVNPQASPRSVYASPRSNHTQDHVHVTTENTLSSQKEIQHHQPHKDRKVLVSKSQSPRKERGEKTSREEVQETMTRKEVEDIMTQQNVDPTMSHANFITSIEDEHDVTAHDFSGSWTTSDYGTMSPRNDLSFVSQDSGFLSTGLSSFGHPSSRPHDLKSKNQDHEPLSVDGRDAAVASKPGVSDDTLMTKSVHEEETKCEIGLLEKSSMMTTSLGNDGRLVQSKMSRSGDTPDGPFEKGFFDTVTLEQSLEMTVPTHGQTPHGVASKGSVTAEQGNRELGVASAAQRDVRDRMTKDDVKRALIRKDSWIYVDLDQGWNVYRMLLPLYRIMCYALTRPEMPYF